MLKFIVLVVVLLLIKKCHCQVQVNYTWPGPISVPENHLIVAPPDSVFIQLSNDGATKRELKVREDVDSIVDCSLILATIGVTNTTQLTWHLRQFRANQQWDPFESVVLETINPDPELPSFTFSGDYNEMLIIGQSSSPQIAREGNAGDYRCEVCETSELTNCLSGNITFSVFVFIHPPVIVLGPMYAPDSYYIGGNVCVLPNNPLVLVVTCIHNTSLPTTLEPPMTAVWTQNGGPLNIYSYAERIGDIRDGDLIISTDQDFASILGVYTCVLMNTGANDTASTVVSKCCEEGDIPVINNSSGFVEVPPNDGLMIGQATCLNERKDPITLLCLLSSTPLFHETTYTWSKDGMVLDHDTSSINVTMGGQYVCNASTECGEDRHTSQIFDIPKINSISSSIDGITGDGCDRRGSETTSSSLCPKPTERFTISCDSVTSYTITGPGGIISNNSPLVIDSASNSNVGMYLCTSNNLCGSASSQITVTLGQENGDWTVSDWSRCSAPCGDGIRTRTVSCVGTLSSNLISEDLCDDVTRQPSSEACNEGACESPVWVEGDWTDCSKDCGMGQQTREVTCQMLSSQQVVSDSNCSGPPPQAMAYCNMSPCCTVDLYPAQCDFIASTSMCNSPLYKDVCCCTCGRVGLGLTTS